jgi:hypothetical protein
MEEAGVAEGLEGDLLARSLAGSARVRLAQHDDNPHAGVPEVGAERGAIDRQLARFHRVADRSGRHATVAIYPERHQMMTGTEGRIDPLVPEDRHARAGGLLVQDACCGAEERIAMDRRSGGRGLGVMRDGDEAAQRERPEADGEEWALTRAPPPGDQTTIDERK